MFHRGDRVATEAPTLDEGLVVEPEARRRPWMDFLVSTPGRCPCWGSCSSRRSSPLL